MEAWRQRAAIVAASAPHMENHARRNLLRQLELRAGGLRGALPDAGPAAEIPKQTTTPDPDAAAAYFAQRGVKVRAS